MLSIIIVSYNVKYFLEQCLCSVQKAIAGIAAEVIVIDNNSADESVAYLKNKFPWVRWVANTVNTGYAKANNQGWQMAAGDCILFLNPDTILSEDCLQRSLAALSEQAGRGALGIHMLDGGGQFLPESKRGFPAPMTSLFKLSGLIKIFPHSRTIARYYQGHLPEKESNDVEVLSGAYMMVKKQVLEKTGGFDEQFFMYGEDIDLSYRIIQAGYTNHYLANSSIIHFKGESTRKNFAYTRLFYKAMDIFVEKHYGGQSRWFSLLVKTGIALGGLLSYLRQLLAHLSVAKKSKTGSTLIVGDDAATAKAGNALLHGQAQNRRITTVRGIREMEEVLQVQSINEIIFCVGTITYKAIIGSIEKMGSGRLYKFFAQGSSSITGSSSKKSSGETIVLE